MSNMLRLILLIWSGSVFAADVAEIQFVCPVTLDVHQVGTSPSNDWTSVDGQGKQSLLRVGFFLHHPNQRGALVPDSTARHKMEEQVTWSFPRNPGDDFWLGCIYTDTTAMLVRKLSDSVTACSVNYVLLPTGVRSEIKNILCVQRKVP